MPTPLAGIRVIDLTSVVMGPFATQILTEHGAEVIKIEAPGGDIMRHIAPMRSAGMGHPFLNANRGKKSVVLDLKQASARAALMRLLADADVMISNVRPQAMARLGLGYGDVVAARPDIVYLALTGFGDNGAYSGRPAYDDLIQGYVGLPWMAAQASGGAPAYVPAALCDRITGMAAVNALLAALLHRSRSGEGQCIEVPMFETLAQVILGDHLGGETFDPPLGPPGYARMLAPSRRPFRTSDGYICALIYTDRQWRDFFTAIGRAGQFSADPRLQDHTTRSKHYAEIYDLVAELMGERSSAEWLALFELLDIPVAPVNSLHALIDDPHLAQRRMFEQVEHPSEGKLRAIQSPARWTRTQPRAHGHAPRLGEHSLALLRAAGLAEAELDAMLASGAVRADETAAVSQTAAAT